MEFGTWMQTMRAQRKLDIRAFARLVGVDASTISRLENSRSQVTLSTAVRICESIGTGPEELLWALQGKPLRLVNQRQKSQAAAVFTLQDVEALLTFLRTHWQEGCCWLTSLLNRIVWHESSVQQKVGSGKHLFVVEDIEKLLLDSHLYSFEVQYPQALQAEAGSRAT